MQTQIATSTIKILQINLHNCKAANALLAVYLEEHKYDVALIHDVHLSDNWPSSFPRTWRKLSSSNKQAWIIIRNNTLIYTPLAKYTSSLFISLTTTVGEIILGSQYIPPSADFEAGLEEWRDLIQYEKPFFLSGDLNARSQLWGYTHEDERGSVLIEHLVSTHLTIGNTEDCPPTFITSRAQGWPDFTITNTKGIDLLQNWRVEDVFTSSDHKYIHYEIQAVPHHIHRRRYKTEHGNHSLFKKHYKSSAELFSTKLSSITSKDDLDTFTEQLLNSIQQACKQTYRMKPIKKKVTFTWWTPALRTLRNKITALKRKRKLITEEDLVNYNIELKRIKAQYRKQLTHTKKIAWKNFCNQQKDPFGPGYKIAHDKLFTPDEIEVLWTNTETSKKNSMINLTKAIFPSVNASAPITSINITPYSSPMDVAFTKSEVRKALYTFNIKKAPGPDQIDFRVLRLAFEVTPQIFTAWCNKALSLGHFPRPLRKGEVVYFLKHGKNPSIPNSYRPICLLPTLGKLLEKLIVQRLTYHLESKQLLSDKQYGFRDSRSCEHALQAILEKAKEKIEDGQYTTLVSIDVKGAFDNVPWNAIRKSLQALKCPLNIYELISSYLEDRKIQINWGNGQEDFSITKGCAQGSCLGPILWNVVADTILKRSKEFGGEIFAYADDFSLILSGPRRKDIEEQAILHLNSVIDQLNKLGLEISADKSTALTFSRPRNLKRMPVIHIHKRSIRHVSSVKLLGITIDRQLNWFPHIEALRIKVLKTTMRIHRLATKTWGIQTATLKTWYQATTEKQLTYAAGVWGTNLTKHAKQKLASIQRISLLSIARAYRTTSTDALNIITGIPPIILTIEKEAKVMKTLRLHKSLNTFPSSHNINYERKVPRWKIHPAEETPEIQIKLKTIVSSPSPRLSIYTDGSKTEMGVAAAYCVTTENKVIHKWSTRLSLYNSVYQAELFAIIKALEWLITSETLNENLFVPIYSDSLSSLLAIKSHRTSNPMVLQAKLHLQKLIHKTQLRHVKAHIGITGNELADKLAKETTETQDQMTLLPGPASHLKNIFKHHVYTKWKDQWNNSSKGRHTYKLMPAPLQFKPDLPNHLTCFLTGHGPFPAYLQKFHRHRTGLCECGILGDSLHYVFKCQLTSQWHLTQPESAHFKVWTLSILRSHSARTKLRNIFNFLMTVRLVTD